MTKLTKVVATIGPATESPEVITELIQAGMNVARFNTKHADPEWHNQRIQVVKKVAAELNQSTAVLLDLQGPEIRIVLPNEESFDVPTNETVTFTADPKAPTGQRFIIIPASMIGALSVGNTILLADGTCDFEVIEKGENWLKAKARFACTVKHRKTMNTPGITPQDLPSLTERDYQYLDGVKTELYEYVGLSFVRNKQDIDQLRAELKKRGSTAHIVAKIENQQALENLEEIVAASDAVMVARGDLGVEVAFQELIYWQRKIITLCRESAKPVITATEMLKSMVENPRPTRAEVSDVAHAIYDGTDAVMLSDETTIGKYPVKAVATQTAIAEFNEGHGVPVIEPRDTQRSDVAITQAAYSLLQHSDVTIDKVLCLTETGRSVELIARFRPDVPVYGLTSVESTYRRLSLLFGVQPVLLEVSTDQITSDDNLIEICKELKMVSPGEKILMIRGKFWRESGFTNTISILDIS
jgi:pyruvate kinase